MRLARRIEAVGVLVAAVLVAVPAKSLAAANASCAERVLRDWSDDGKIEKTFAPRCYREAIARLPTDVRVYSSAEDDITRALTRVATRRSAHAPRSLSSGRVALHKPRAVAGPGRRPLASIAASVLALAVITWVVLAARRRSARDDSPRNWGN